MEISLHTEINELTGCINYVELNVFSGLRQFFGQQKGHPAHINMRVGTANSTFNFCLTNLFFPEITPYWVSLEMDDTRFFTGQMAFLSPNRQCQSFEGIKSWTVGLYKRQCAEQTDDSHIA